MKLKVHKLLFNVMKLSVGGTLLQCLFLSLVFAAKIDAQSYQSVREVHLNIQRQDASIQELFQLIEQNTSFIINYDDRHLSGAKARITIKGNYTVADILLKISEEANLKFKQVNNTINVERLKNRANEKEIEVIIQGVTITGTVTSMEDGEPLPGVNVIEKGTNNGAVTDLDGNYSIEVQQGATLVFSSIGFVREEVGIGGRSVVNLAMSPDIRALEEIVVTALGFEREEKALGYAVQKVGGETLSTVKGVDVGTSLTGKVAGLLVRNSTEFAAEPVIQIRGENPLLVIDGVPYQNMTLRDIPSDDIKSIDVLKGATASALYGYRGESGAIMITTKKGSEQRGLQVSVNSGTMLTAGYLAIPEMQSTYGRRVNAATNTYVGGGDGSWGPPLEGQEVIQWDPVSKSYQPMPYLPIGKDNFKNFLEQGYILNNNVSLVQQGEFGSIRSSATWVRNKGQYPNSNFDKVTYSLGGEMKVDKFSLSSSISYNKQSSPNVGFGGYTGYDPMYNLLVWSSPDYDIRQYEDYWLVKDETQNNSYTSTNNNPYFDRNERLRGLNRDVFNGYVSLNYDLADWLKATVRSGFDTYSEYQTVRISKGSYVGGGSSTVIRGGTEIWGESKNGSYNAGLGRGYSLNNDFMLSGDHTFGDFNIDGMAGASMFYTQDEGIQTRTQGGLLIPGYYSLNSSVNPVAVNSRIYKRQVNSLFGRMSVSWKNIVFAEGTLRNDWSSTLSENTRSYLYPSLSGSFIASELLPQMDWLSLWKLRASWTTSKNMANPYDINTVYSVSNNAWGSLSSARYPTGIRGSEVRPAAAETFEIGSVVNIFENRASLDVAVYRKRMYDFIVFAPISPASGYTSNYMNSGEEITRRGIEITANLTPIKSRDWTWDLSFNWSKYARYYTQLDSVFSPDRLWIKEGERADHYTIQEFLRDQEGNIIHHNGLPVYSSYQTLAGYSDPDWIWGLSSSVNYKKLTLGISLDGRVGGLAQTTTEMYMWTSGNHPESVTEERYLDATQGGNNYVGQGVKVVAGAVEYDTYGRITNDTREFAPNDHAVTYESYVKRIHKGTAWGGSPSPLDLYSTTFLKIRELSLTYRLPENAFSIIGAKGGSISAVGQNVLLWAKDFKYSDPDGGTENFADPSQRYFGLNLKVDF